MNTTNLRDLREEMKKLGFSETLTTQMEDRMIAGEKEFVLHDQVAAQKGHVGIDLHFRQSNSSEFFYLNRLEATRHWGRGLEKGQQYMILGINKDGEIAVMTGADSLREAIRTYQSMSGFKGEVELAAGSSLEDRVRMATMEGGRETYVATEFKRDFDRPELAQVFWLDRGRGFTREQAANLMQGRSVYREDLLSRDGKPYSAWLQLDLEARERAKEKPVGQEKDGQEQDGPEKGGEEKVQANLPLKKFYDNYGFDLAEVLSAYKIKELEDVDKSELLQAKLKEGNRVAVTVEKDGKETGVMVETSVRYGKLNFYDLKGGIEKREQFEKVQDRKVDKGLEVVRDKARSEKKSVETEQGIGI